MDTAKLPPYIQALLNPEVFSHPAEDLKLVQTHISYVILAGDFVYKFKKEVDFGFLDFSTPAKRKKCCEQELVLNRRLCPDIYLGLVTVYQGDDGYSLSEPGQVVEHGIRMKRMPEERMMVNILKRGELERAHLDSIVDVLIPFYEQAEHNSEIDGFGTAQAVGVNVLENFEQTKQFVGSEALSRTQFEVISGYASTFLQDTGKFTARIEAGRIRDCHGDLYSANICLDEQVHIYDCIEFNRRFRYSDVASDIAFLAMDLDFHRQNEAASYLVERFQADSGDTSLGEMLDFYKCYRAYVRGKIGLFTAGDPAVDAAVKKSSLAAAKQYFQLAWQYATANG